MEDFIFMKLSQDEKLIVEELRNLANGDLNVNDVNSFLKSLMLLTLMNFSENESTTIPYFGELKIEYLGDKITDKGRIADLKVDFVPSATLIKNIGQLIDVKNPNCDTKVTDVECIQDLMKDIGNRLNEIMKREEFTY